MIIPKLINYLSENLEVYVGMEAPNETEYVLIDQTGSSRQNHVITTSVAIQSYGSTLYDALVLNERVKNAMADFVADEQVTRVQLDTDYNFTNTATKQFRWQAVFLITHY